MLIESVESSSVFFSELVRNPHDVHRVSASCVGQQLTEVSVIGSLKLVLNDDLVACVDFLADEIKREVPNGMLSLTEVKIQS